MKKRTFDHLIPPWTDVRTHRTFFLFCVGGALILSLCLYLPQLDLARTGLYYNGVAGEVHRLYADARMPYFADLVSSQGHVSNFYSQPVFFPLVLLILGAVALAVYNYANLRRGAKSNYLMSVSDDMAFVKSQMQKNLRGELTE